METVPKEKSLALLPFATHATRGLIRDRSARRKIMLGVVLLALCLVAAGATLLKGVLDHRIHLVWFILYWFVCAWLALLALLLALFDLLVLRAQARAERRDLGQQFSGPQTRDSQSRGRTDNRRRED